MPSWTLGDLMSQATARIGRRSDIAASDASLWVNQAYQDFIREVPQLSNETWQIFSLNSGDSRIALPNNYLETISISMHTNSGNLGEFPQLRQVGVEWADAQGYYPVSTPEAYFLFENGIHIWPAANSSALTTVWSGRSYIHRYRAIPPDMVSTGSTPSVMTECRIGILYLAEAYLNELIGNYVEAAEARVRYASYAASVKDAFAKRQVARGGRFAIQLADRSGRRRTPEGNLEDQDEWLRR